MLTFLHRVYLLIFPRDYTPICLRLFTLKYPPICLTFHKSPFLQACHAILPYASLLSYSLLANLPSRLQGPYTIKRFTPSPRLLSRPTDMTSRALSTVFPVNAIESLFFRHYTSKTTFKNTWNLKWNHESIPSVLRACVFQYGPVLLFLVCLPWSFIQPP